MIQSTGENRREIDGKFEQIRVAVCGQHSSTSTKHSWNSLLKDNFILQAGKELAGLTHREPEHVVMVLRTLPCWLLSLTCLHSSSPSPADGLEPQFIPAWGHSSCKNGQHCSCCSLVRLLEQSHPQAPAGPTHGHQIRLVQTVGKRSLGLYAPGFLSMQKTVCQKLLKH